MQRVRRNRHEHGFSLVEVLIAVVVLGVTGVALLNGLQSTVLKGRSSAASATTALSLSAAVEVLKAAPFVSCATDATPYEPLPNGLVMPAGMTLDIQEFVATALTPWQNCANVTSAGSAQQILIRDAAGNQRQFLRFAPSGATPTSSPTPTGTPTPTPTTALNATVTVDQSVGCTSFRNSGTSKQCAITFTRSAGSGTQWHLQTVTFAGGAILNPAPTAPVSQSSTITLSTYVTDGGGSCPRGSVLPITVLLVDDGNGSTLTLNPTVRC